MTDAVDKVRKLLNLAEGKGATPAEAAVALATAERLMARHRLERADVMREGEGAEAVEDGAAEPLFTSRRRMPWVLGLAAGVAAAQHCRTYLRPTPPGAEHGWSVCLVGRASDMQVARYLFAYAHREIERLAADARDSGVLCGGNEVNSFKWGAAEIVVARMHLARTEAERAFRQQHGQAAQTAIVRVSERDTEVELWMKKQFKLERPKKRRGNKIDQYGRQLGHDAGSRIALTPAVEGKTEAPARRLAAEFVAHSERYGLAELVRWHCECGSGGQGSLAADGSITRGSAPENAPEIKARCIACTRRKETTP